MQRNIPRTVRLGSASTRRLEQTRLKRSIINRCKLPHKTAKTRGSYLPGPKVLRIQQLYVAGENKSEIAKKEKVDRGTVARILKFPEVRNFIAQAQGEFFGLIPDAMAAIRHALKVENNPTIALAVLERTGVSAHRGERMQMPATAAEDGYSRQAVMIANVLLEGREHMGLNLGSEIEEALAKDTQENMEAGKTSGENLPRVSEFRENGSRSSRKITSRN
jgi:hypothetical protein